MASEPRTIKGPCFDCDDTEYGCLCLHLDDDDLICPCHSPLGERTAPITKLERELESERAESDNE